MPYIVQKRDLLDHWVDMLVSQTGAPAFQYYKEIEKQMGKHDVRILIAPPQNSKAKVFQKKG